MDGQAAGHQPPARKPFDIKRELYDWARALVTAAIAVVLVFTLLVRVLGVDGDSMLPTLHDGEKLLVARLFTMPEQGDIIVFTQKGFRTMEDKWSKEEPLVKRVIATEGQTVDIDVKKGVVMVDEKPLNEPYNMPTHIKGTISLPYMVEPGCVFVMGDNRDNSFDSRFQEIGAVDIRYILGKVLFRVLPVNRIGFVS